MSIKVCGLIELNDTNVPYQEKINLSFFITKEAVKNKIGINFGNRIFSGFLESYKKSPEKIPFELTDYPMDINAEELFAGKGIELCPTSNIKKTLRSRMCRVQTFLNELLKNKFINKIILDINAIDIDENNIKILRVEVCNFCEKMLELYECENNWTPTIRIIVEAEE